MWKPNYTLFLLLSSLAFPPTAMASTSSTSASLAPSPGTPSARDEAERLWKLRADVRQMPALLAASERWVAQEPNNVDALLRLARASYFMVYLHESGGTLEKRLQIMLKGTDAARKVTRLQPSNMAGEFWASTNLAVYGKLKGPLESVASLSEIKSRMETVEAKEPNLFYGGVWRFWGRLIDQVPSALRMLNGYDLDDALEFHRKAIKVEPRYVQSHLFYAECLIQAGKREEARAVLEKALKLDPQAMPDVAPENTVILQQVKRLYAAEFSKK